MRTAMTMIVLMIGLNLMLFYFGLNPSGTTSWLYTTMFSPEQITTEGAIQNHLLGKITVSIVGLLAAGAVIFGFMTGQGELVVFSSIATTLLLLVPDWISIYRAVASASQMLATLIIAPIFIMYILVIADYWRGKD